jgi:hypothetical protein
MSLKLALLKKVKQRPTKVVAQCPACAEAGGDTKGVHLVVYPDGKFGCTANPKDKAHRRRIAELSGDPARQVKPWTLKLHGKVVLSGSHPLPTKGIPITSLARSNVERLKKSAGTPSQTSAGSLLGQLGRPFPISPLPKNNLDPEDTVYPVCIGGPATPSQTSQNTITITPSGVSEDVITKALALFGGKIVGVIPPDAIVPGRFRDTLATWTPTRNHPGLQGYTPRRLLGWKKRGAPIYADESPWDFSNATPHYLKNNLWKHHQIYRL